MWYKIAQKTFNYEETFSIKDFSDRNLLNAKVRALQDMSNMLRYCSQLVYQTQRGARGVVSQIRTNKKISSYPGIIMILDQADKIALDSPIKFADLCKQAAFELDLRIKKLIQIRKDFAAGETDPLKPKKGLF